MFPLSKSLFENAAIINSYFPQKIRGHNPKTDKAVKSEIELDIPIMITDLVTISKQA
jgi:hypothetical protein